MPLAKSTLFPNKLSFSIEKSSSTSEHASPSGDELSKIIMYLDMYNTDIPNVQ